MKRPIIALFVALPSALAWPAAAADLLIFGGPIYTGVAAAPKAEAVLVDKDRIAFVGPLTEARRRAGGAREIDLKGAAAYPGFADAHAHLTGIGLREMTLNLDQVTSVEALVAAVRAHTQAHPQATVIQGRGWIETHWPEKRFPTRADLERAVADRPVVLERADGHAVVANGAALALAGITRATPDPKGGQILKDERGEPTGMLVDRATGLVEARLPRPTPAMILEATERGAHLYAARGWTAIGNMSVSAGDLQAQEQLAARGRLPIRVDDYMDPPAAGRVLSQGPYADPSGLVRVRGVKIYVDGALGSRGAALLQPYSDAPASSGLLVTERAEAAPILRRALAARAQVAAHAIGDRGNRLALDWFAEALGSDKTRRWRVEHAQVISPPDLPRFAGAGVIASMQPSHAIGDLYFAPARLGETRLKGAYAWRSLLDSGAMVAAGSDAPVEVGSPLIEFYAAVARKDLQGKSGPDWHPEEAVSRERALKMLTWAPAYAAFAEQDRGTLEAGKKADITVFSKDLMIVPEADILKAEAVLTVVDGKVVHEARR
ncbi:MAG TPA: amidohydrolase [Caulobacteraceae bacterium]|jgi:hypothetical protein